MTHKEFLKELKKVYDKNLKISTAKNADYAGNDNAFKNFEVVEYLTNGRISTAEGIFVRMCDKMQRISNLLVAENKVADEKVGDTLADLANYAVILKIYLSMTKEKSKLSNLPF